jgi:DNA-binding Lrp family transcriptional regulator
MPARRDSGPTHNDSRIRSPRGNAARARLDDIDLEILGYLVHDARISQRALSRAIGMSPPAVADRIARLESTGVIEGYRATVNFAALGRPMTVIVDVVSEPSAVQRELARNLAEIPEVERVDIVTGSTDLQVRLHVRDQKHLNDVLFDTLLASAEIRHTETYLALSEFQPDNFSYRLLQHVAEELVNRDDEDG